MSTTVKTPLSEIKKELDSWFSDYLRDSEKSGNTPTETQVKKKLEEKAAELLDKKFSSGNYSAEMERSVRNSIQNHIETDCMSDYKNSLLWYKREENGEEPFEVSESMEDACKEIINLISKQIKREYDSLLKEIVSTGNVPSKEQINAYLNAKATTLVSTHLKDVDSKTQQYVKNKVTNTVNACVEKYGEAVKNNNLIINGKMPSHQDTNRDEMDENAARVGYERIKDVYESFSGCDMVCTISITLPGKATPIGNIVVGYLQTLSYSIHQDKAPVRNIGNMNAKDYTFGPRTIAGSLVFALFNKHWMYDLMEIYREKENISTTNHFLVDEMPPFDITITAANEYGRKARMALYGVRLMNEGMVVSVNDIYTENTYQYVATNIDYFSDTTYLKDSVNRNKTITSNVSEIAVQTPVTEEKIKNTESTEAPITQINIPTEAEVIAGAKTKKEAKKLVEKERKRLLKEIKELKKQGEEDGTYTLEQYKADKEKINQTMDAYKNEYIPRSGKLKDDD